MRICRVRREVFLHNPKAAGISLGRWLEDERGYAPVVSNLDALVRPCDGVIWRHNPEVPEEFRRWKTWCVVRNPLDRWGSFWNFVRRLRADVDLMGFEQFSRTCLSWLPEQYSYIQRSTLWIRFENLHEGLGALGLGPVDRLPWLNKTGEAVPWTGPLRESVAHHFRRDFEVLGYQAENRTTI